jgi:outer membrane protein TolC
LRSRARSFARTAAALAVALGPGCVTPQPIADETRLARARADLELMFSGQEPVEAPIDLYAAMGRAVKYNLDQRVSRFEETLADRRLSDARLDMLPSLVANDGYYGRSNEAGASSQSLLSGQESLEPSTSQERYTWRSDLTVAWNVLDFGVSYVRAKQQADEVLIARERRTKAMQDILVDVRGTFYRGVAAQRLLPEVDALQAQGGEALERSREMDQEQLLDPDVALSYQRSLLEKLDELAELRRDLEVARTQLAAAMNVRPGTNFELAAPGDDELPVPELDLPIESMEMNALVSRPELREEDYRSRIAHLEVRRALLGVLPGVELSLGRNRDDNRFLYNEDWWSYSAILSKNLIEIVTAPSEIAVARAGVAVDETRRLAVSMAVMAQVHVAWRRYLSAAEELQVAEHLRDVERRSHEITRQRVAAESESELELIRRATHRMASDLRYFVAYADLQESYGRLLASLGVHPLQDGDELGSSQEVALRIRRSLDDWQRRAGVLRDHPGSVVFPASLADR